MSLFAYITADVVVFFLIGACLGVHYGLDGWIGTTEPESLKDSPRLKNFRWVVGVGLFAFVADLKALGIDGNKKYGTLAYLLGFILAGAALIVSFALVILFRARSFKSSEPDKYPDQPFTPVIDYVLYGYQYHRQRYEEAVQKKSAGQVQEGTIIRKRFAPEYAKHVSYSMGAVQSLGDDATRERLDFAIIQLLRLIKGVVLEYHQKDAPQINVNVMIAYPRNQLPNELRRKVRFTYGDHSQYSHYLAIRAYADEEGKEDFVLPIENVADSKTSVHRSLPGAPLAFLKKDFEIIDDTQKIQYGKSLPVDLKKEVTDYFKTKSFKSFGCVTITGRNATQLGILVIESDNKYVFGKTDKAKSELNLLLKPFALLMGNLIVADQKLRSL